MFLLFLSKNIPHCRGQLKYHTVRAIKIPHWRNSKNIPHCRWQLNYHTLGTIRIFHIFLQCGILIALAVWYFNSPRQCGMFLLFRQFDISHCWGQLKYHTARAIKIPHYGNSKNIPHCRGQLKYHTVGTVRTFHIMWNVLTVPIVWYFNCPSSVVF
jgi:hypothetical protein